MCFEILVSVLKPKVTVSVLSYNIDGKDGSQVRWEDKANMKRMVESKYVLGVLDVQKNISIF
jgi:hypothetical protein